MGYTLIRVFVAIVLLVAAGLKAHQLATEPVAGVWLLDSRWPLIATIEFELLFGLWLMAGLLPKPSWAVTLACFGLFAGISFYKAISGHASCGCFGRVPINPWYTATLDIAIVASLLRWRPKEAESALAVHFQEFRLRAMVVFVIWFVIGVPTALALRTYTATTLSDAGTIIADGQIVVLEPEKWIGKRFPLLDYIDIGEKLKEGKWLVVLYRHDCPRCEEMVKALEKSLHRVPKNSGGRQVALIEIMPLISRKGVHAITNPLLIYGQLSNEKDWFAATPIEIELNAGSVIRLSENAE